MAFPFGGHPTLARFVEFAQEQGCAAEMLVRQRKNGQPYQVLEIKNPAGGGRLAIPDPDLMEHLTPSVVANYQRRLGLRTPFASKPEPTPPETPTTPES